MGKKMGKYDKLIIQLKWAYFENLFIWNLGLDS